MNGSAAYGLWPLVIINSAVFVIGFLLQWPTLLTLFMFPVLVWMYVRLARREERLALADFGDAYSRYAEVTPAFIPRLRSPRRTAAVQTGK